MNEHHRSAIAQLAGAGIEDGLSLPVPVYLEYPPAGWPDAFPPRNASMSIMRLPILRRIALVATVPVIPAGIAQ
jgi:hypothetical protein